MKQYDFEQYSDEWWAARLGKPSASNGKRLVTSTGAVSKQMSDYAIELANDIYAGEAVDKWSGNAHTERGTELEGEARDYYQFVQNTDVSEVGMFMDDGMKYIASPDGVVGDDGLLEIKCCSGKVHTKNLLYYAKNKKTPTDYVAQLQMQMFISGREWVDLLFYHPTLPSLIIRTVLDEKVAKTLDEQLSKVLIERDSIIEILRKM